MKQVIDFSTPVVRADKQVLRADGEESAEGRAWYESLFDNLGGILTGAGNLAQGVNNKTTSTSSTSYVEDKKSLSLNNGTTIAAIICVAVIVVVLLVLLLRK